MVSASSALPAISVTFFLFLHVFFNLLANHHLVVLGRRLLIWRNLYSLVFLPIGTNNKSVYQKVAFMKKGIFLLLVVAISMLPGLMIVYAQNSVLAEIDLSGQATYIVDGDTFDVTVANGTQYRIRLADVNASEKGHAGYSESKAYLSMLLFGKTVYLDVDDVYIYEDWGRGDRLVCVPYVEYNSTHFLNINEALLEAGRAEIKDYVNEFSPFSWTLYVSKQAVPEFMFPALVMIVIGIALMVVLRKIAKSKRSVH